MTLLRLHGRLASDWNKCQKGHSQPRFIHADSISVYTSAALLTKICIFAKFKTCIFRKIECWLNRISLLNVSVKVYCWSSSRLHVGRYVWTVWDSLRDDLTGISKSANHKHHLLTCDENCVWTEFCVIISFYGYSSMAKTSEKSIQSVWLIRQQVVLSVRLSAVTKFDPRTQSMLRRWPNWSALMSKAFEKNTVSVH